MNQDSRSPSQEALEKELAREEARLAGLTADAERARTRIDSLKQDLARVQTEEVPRPAPVTPSTSDAATRSKAEKVALFRTLFRGRQDVFPRRWENAKAGKSGYSPACANEWVRGVCAKTNRAAGKVRVVCGECPERAFVPVADAEVEKHLRGQQVMGAYPLLEDETCWFLAADFDKRAWQEDVAAFRETCHERGVPVAIERSRSGNGAHAWFFFSEPVAAAVARRMGCYLITETMARRHELGMDSYDRLFPNQDTMPRGGFGNLIALPLQRAARQAGNTEFVDEAFAPYADQWEYLAGVRRMTPRDVQRIAEEAARQGQILGVRVAEGEEDEDAAPWTRAPSGRPRKLRIAGPLPAEVHAVLSQRLFIETQGLPSALLNQVKRVAAFQNPDFYKKQGMRLSTALTPRIISCAEDHPQHVSVPRGCQEDVEALLREHGVGLSVRDDRSDGEPGGFRFDGTLTPIQEQAVAELLRHDTGVFVAPPGVGKTVVGTYMVSARGRSTLILVHRQPLMEQWVAQLALFLGIEPSAIGRIGAGKHKPNGRLDVATIQSLVRREAVDDSVASYGHVIVDECHHLPAVSFERVLNQVKARFVLGLTATPRRRDGHHPILEMQLGPTRFAVNPNSQGARRPFDHRLIVRDTEFRLPEAETEAGIQAIYAALVKDEARNHAILDDVRAAVAEGRSPILLTERRDHLEFFAERLRDAAPHVVVLQGGMGAKQRRAVAEQLASIPEGEPRLLLATGRYIGEGFDDARLDTLFLALPVSWRGTLVQYAGRLHRLHAGKTEVRVYDYADRDVPILARMFAKRLRGYRAIGYAQDEESLDLLEDEAAPPLPDAGQASLDGLDDER